MPRLKFDLKPVDRNSENQHWSQEENDAWIRDIWKRWEREGEPTTCDCGFYGDGWLVTCDPKDRRRCHGDLEKRLQAHYRHKHDRFLASKRQFPEQPSLGGGRCRWCTGEIVHGQAKLRTSHDGRKDEPDCKWEYRLRTDLAAQRAHLTSRDGIGCSECGVVVGRWGLIWACAEHRADEYGYEGGTSVIQWETGLEVDHFIALAVAFECFPEPARRRWFFGPRNLRMLCNGCHKIKTNRDRALLRAIATHGVEHGKAAVLGMLKEAGLLKEKPL